MSSHKKFHRKSKNGCKSCRQRRVKCNEQRPTCSNCLKREETCLWFDNDAESTDNALVNLSPSPSGPIVIPSPFSVVPSPSYEPLDINNLHLLHHYSTSPYLFPQGSPVMRVKSVLPHIGFNHEFFLRAILAISSLHIAISGADLRPNVDYLSLSDIYIDQTKAGLFLAEQDYPTPERDAAIFMGWIFVALCTLARPRTVTTSWTPKVLDYISIAQRCQLFRRYDSLRVGPTGPISFMPFGPSGAHQGKTFEFPAALLDIHLPTSAAPDSEEVIDAHVAQVYEIAVKRLRLSFMLDAVSGDHAAGIFAWPVAMSDEFHGFLKEQRPRALVILAHFCVIVERNMGHWWESDLDDNIKKISGVLDSNWLSFMNASFLTYREEVI